MKYVQKKKKIVSEEYVRMSFLIRMKTVESIRIPTFFSYSRDICWN